MAVNREHSSGDPWARRGFGGLDQEVGSQEYYKRNRHRVDSRCLVVPVYKALVGEHLFE